MLFVCLSCVVLFGLMATRLNKHYYYYYYHVTEVDQKCLETLYYARLKVKTTECNMEGQNGK